ncbi:MAG: DPP IV N-terminal domain-containing protein [Candidatus Saccharicenans sp.]|nr:DPP IV N-terminal domain-containing protein [Candidatus Saccharicenans sp.]
MALLFWGSGKIGFAVDTETRVIKSWAQVSDDIELKLRQIFDRGEFNARLFRGIWLTDGSGYTVLERNTEEGGLEVVRYEVATGKRTVLTPLSKLIPAGESRPLQIENYALSPDGSFVLIQTGGRQDPERASTVVDYWLFDIKSSTLRKLVSGVDPAPIARSFSPDNRKVLYYLKENIYVYNLDTSQSQPVTSDGVVDTISNGNAVWSPDGKHVAFIQADYSNVMLRPILEPVDPTYPKVRYVRYARVGTPIPRLRPGVINVAEGRVLWLSVGDEPAGFYLRELNWLKNSREVCLEKLSRFRDHREFIVASIQTGTITRVYQETDPAWVDASYGTNAGLEWIDNDRSFILVSEKDGWRRAYIISRKDLKERALTPGGIDIISRVGADEKQGWFYYLASPGDATRRYLYRVRLDGKGRAERLTPADKPGVHSYELSPDGRYAFHVYSTFDDPPVTSLVRLPDHREVRTLEDNGELRSKLAAVIRQPVEFLQIEIGDGLVLDAWMVKPSDFNPAKKYPVFIWVYGEPHLQTVLDEWQGARGLFHRVIAETGYLVISIDNRGTPAPKGAAWRRAIFGSLGPLSTREHAAAMRELGRKRSCVDLSRVGIWGWSGGGSNTLNALFREPDVYQVGIAVVPKPQPHLYNAWFQEIYMRTPEVNPDGYKQSAPINFAEGLKGKLLIIHGTGETNTHLQIVEGLVDRLIELGKQFDYMTYPNRDHGLREGAGTVTHVYMLIARYLITNLPPGPR